MGCTQSAIPLQKLGRRKRTDFFQYYDLGKKLGVGSYAEVFEAIDKETHLVYAVKITQLRKDAESTSIRREINMLKSLDHPNIVKFVENFEIAGESTIYFYTVTEMLKGGELFDRIVKKTFYDEKEARDLIFTVLSAIKYLHDRKVVHRDLKPENLLLSSEADDAMVKIADFGFAAVAEGQDLSTPCGSPGYLAPEVLLHKSYGRAVDLWSLGVIAYILLGGYPPFHDSDPRKVMQKIKAGNFEFHPAFWSNVSEHAKSFIRGLLTYNPAKRMTADEALQHVWITMTPNSFVLRDLTKNQAELKKFLERRKLRIAVKSVIALQRLHTVDKAADLTRTQYLAAQDLHPTNNFIASLDVLRMQENISSVQANAVALHDALMETIIDSTIGLSQTAEDAAEDGPKNR